MNCREFETKLWDTPGEYKNKESLPPDMAGHMSECPECSRAYEKFAGLFNMAGNSEIRVRDNFDDKVWQKIESVSAGKAAGSISHRGRYNLGFGQLAASLAVAAGTVAMIMLAITNISDMPGKNAVPRMVEKTQSRLRAERDITLPKSSRTEYHFTISRDSLGGLRLMEFSLLPEPEVSKVGDSSEVRIEGAYLTDEGLDETTPTVARANIHDLLSNAGEADTPTQTFGAVLSEAPVTDYVITIEKMPRMIKAVTPDYPPFAYKIRRGGEVWIKALVDSEGIVRQAKIHRDSGLDFGFEEAAIEAAHKNQFEPFEIDGERIPVWVIYKVQFISRD